MTNLLPATKPASTSSGSRTRASKPPTTFPIPTSSPKKSWTTSSPPSNNSGLLRMTLEADMKSKADRRWNRDVERNIQKLGAVKRWLVRWIENKSTDWESQKSAHQAMMLIEMAEFEMWNMQWWRNGKEQKLYFKAETELNSLRR